MINLGRNSRASAGFSVTCAAGAATLRAIVEDDIPGHVRRVSLILGEKLAEIAKETGTIKEIRQMGLLVGIELHQAIAGDALTRCMEHGLLVNRTSPTCIRLAPPLIITEAHIEQACAVIGEALKAATAA